VSKMVIVVMSELKSDRCTVGKFVAESLDWEFAEIDSICSSNITTAPVRSDRNRQMQALTDTIDSAVYAWRDVVISCPILTHEEERQLRSKSTLVNFLRLEAADREPNQAVDMKISPSPIHEGGLHQCDEGVICVHRFQGTDHMLAAICSEVILRRKPNSAQS
jgi:hypothetical protein